MTGKTTSGFEYYVNDKVFDNMELVDIIAEATEDNPMVAHRLVKMVLGDEQREKMYNHLRTEDGRVPIASVFQVIGEIFSAFNGGKNS